MDERPDGVNEGGEKESEMFQLEYFDEPGGKWRALGDGRERPSQAWDGAVEEVVRGRLRDGALFRVTTPGDDHQDDCALGIGGESCDCGAEAIVALEGRVSVECGMVTSRMSVGKLGPVPFTLTQRFVAEKFQPLDERSWLAAEYERDGASGQALVDAERWRKRQSGETE